MACHAQEPEKQWSVASKNQFPYFDRFFCHFRGHCEVEEKASQISHPSPSALSALLCWSRDEGEGLQPAA